MLRFGSILVVLAVALAIGVVIAVVLDPSVRDPILRKVAAPSSKTYTLKERLAEIAPAAGERLRSKFKAAGIAYPPREVRFVAFKAEKRLELFARDDRGRWHKVHDYPVLAASGEAGPKLREGDLQVPEGIYDVTFLNPNSRFHVSLRLDYPNAFDKARAAEEGRSNLGGDIMIHGRAASIGCLAMGDPAAEELFVLAADVGISKVKAIISPTDFRGMSPVVPAGAPDWTAILYRDISNALAELPVPVGGQG